jgi:C4-type Zn-finger protein
VGKLRQRMTEKGRCPFCDSISYRRLDIDWNSDVLFINCSCDKCGKDFTETFKLYAQEWEID